MPRGNQAVAAVVAFAAEDRDFCGVSRASADKSIARGGNARSGRFHELEARDAVAFGGQAVDLAHLGSG